MLSMLFGYNRKIISKSKRIAHKGIGKMTSILMVIQVVLALIITIAVLLQKSSSIGLGAYTSSNESMFGAKGPAGFLAKFTSLVALLFVINTLALGYYYSQQNSESIMNNPDVNSASDVAIGGDANASTSNTAESADKKEDNGSSSSTTTDAAAVATAVASTVNNEANDSKDSTSTTTSTQADDKTEANATNTTDANTSDVNNTQNGSTTPPTEIKVEENTTTTESSIETTSTEENSSSTSTSTITDAATLAASKITKEAEQEAIISDIDNQRVSTGAHILKGVSFNSGSNVLSQTSTEQINAIVDALKKSPSVKVMLRGHTDNTGKQDANLKLSEKRAKALKADLVAKGIDATRIETEGKGDSTPIASNSTKEGQLLNRRVDIAVIN